MNVSIRNRCPFFFLLFRITLAMTTVREVAECISLSMKDQVLQTKRVIFPDICRSRILKHTRTRRLLKNKKQYNHCSLLTQQNSGSATTAVLYLTVLMLQQPMLTQKCL